MPSAPTKPPSTSYNLRPRRPTSHDNRTSSTPARAPSPTLTRRRLRPALLRQASSTSSTEAGTMSGGTRSANGQRKRKPNGTSVPNGVAVPLEQGHPASSDAPPTVGMDAPRPKPLSKASPPRPTRQRTNSLSMEHFRKLNLELPRKTLHSSIGPITLLLYLFWPADQPVTPIISTIFALLCIILLGDFLRFQFPQVRAIWEKHLGKFMRESEKNKINGTVWYCLGAIICLQFYPRDIAVASIVILSWCDTAASVFGRLISSSRRLSPYSPLLPNPLFGYIPIARKKSLGGTLAGGIVGVGIARGMFGPTWGCLVVGFIAGLAEAIDVGGLDDNLTLPVLSGLMMWAVRATTGLI